MNYPCLSFKIKSGEDVRRHVSNAQNIPYLHVGIVNVEVGHVEKDFAFVTVHYFDKMESFKEFWS